jgi:hypothetical protein
MRLSVRIVCASSLQRVEASQALPVAEKAFMAADPVILLIRLMFW